MIQNLLLTAGQCKSIIVQKTFKNEKKKKKGVPIVVQWK